ALRRRHFAQRGRVDELRRMRRRRAGAAQRRAGVRPAAGVIATGFLFVWLWQSFPFAPCATPSPRLSSSAPADDPVIADVHKLALTSANTGCPAGACHRTARQARVRWRGMTKKATGHHKEGKLVRSRGVPAPELLRERLTPKKKAEG